MLQLIISFGIIITNVRGHYQCFNDTPFSNFSEQLEINYGECKSVKGYKVEEDKEIYEGRWYAVYMGMNEDQIKTTNCLCWDCFFDEDGHFHDFLYSQENGMRRILRDIGTAIDENNGIYEYNYGNNDPNLKAKNTFFYVDEDILAFWEIFCILDKNIYREEMAIAFRRFSDVEKNQEKVEKIYKELEKRGGKTASYKLRHEYCDYPPQMDNPYIKRKKNKKVEICKKNVTTCN